MAKVYQVDWTANNLITEIKKVTTFVFDDAVLEHMTNANRALDFTPEFLAYIASRLDVNNIKASKMKASGTQNTHYRLRDCNGKEYILRMGGEGFDFEQDNSRIRREFECLQKLEGLCPESFHVYFMDDRKQFTPYAYFVGEFLEGKCPGFDVRKYDDQMVIEAARVAKRIHSTDRAILEERCFPKDTWMYSPHDSIYPEFVKDDGSIPVTLYNEILDASKDVLPHVMRSPTGLTHGDFRGANMLQTKSAMKPVDWEFCHVGYQIADVAVFRGQKTFLNLTEQQYSLFLEEYGYGHTLDQKLVLWFFQMKRSIMALYITRSHNLEDMVGNAEVFAPMADQLLQETKELLKNKPK